MDAAVLSGTGSATLALDDATDVHQGTRTQPSDSLASIGIPLWFPLRTAYSAADDRSFRRSSRQRVACSAWAWWSRCGEGYATAGNTLTRSSTHLEPKANETGEPQRLGAEALYRRHAAFVGRFLRSLGARHDEVDDLVQEVFLVAHRRGGYQPGPARPTTWLGAIALNVVGTRRRTERRRPADPVAAPDRDLGRREGQQELLEARESLRKVLQALERMDLAQRALFVLFEIEGEPAPAIAAALGVPIGTVYSRLHAARRAFTEVFIP